MGKTKRTQFGDFAAEYYNPNTAEIALLPVPFDGTSTWMKGADKGPQAILDASFNLEYYDIETGSEVYRRGIFTEPAVVGFAKPEELSEVVQQRIQRLLNAGKFPVLLGGEHSVSVGAFKAFAAKYGKLTILQLDAHADLRDSYEGSTHNHACVMARAREIAPIVQVGIRSMDVCETRDLQMDRVFFAHAIFDNRGTDWIDQVVSKLTENVYLTIDLDVFDPSIMPATGTPEPGGMRWYDALALVRRVCEQRTLVGFDLVELCPRESMWASDLLAAKLLYKILTYKFCL
ncbi:MAG: agmatinase [Planctomycetaceae bacterium]|nr:agmatinase [Planctomycetaceae bacterium]